MTETEVLLAGRYRLGSRLGQGGMATVHRAEDVVLERPVAVKVFRPEAAQPGRATSYEQEARILAGLSHPGLVTVFDAGIDAGSTDGSRAFLVMELVEGATLADVIRDGPLPPRQVAHLGAQIATALAYVHRRGVVHRDVKPANILLAEDDESAGGARAMLTDFGVARLVDSARMTAEGLTVGTAAYLSPEQVGGGAVEAPTDVYSLGLVLLEALTGEVAFPGESLASATERLRRDPRLPDSLDGAWVRLLCSMFERSPAARPAAAEVGLALTGLAAATAPDAPALDLAADADSTTTTALPVVDEIAADDTVVGDAVAPPAPESSGPQPTRVLPVVAEPAAVPHEAAGSETIRSEPAAAARSRVPRRLSRRALGALAAGLLFVVVLLVLVLSTRGQSTAPAPAPSYPTVPGKLGTDLQKLQQQVQP